MTRAIFLDFDGVLHPVGGLPGQTLPFEWLPELMALLSGAPDVAIAVHSSWCERYSLEDLREFLGPLGPRVIGAVGPGPRADAILAFLRARPDINRWLVVDDDQDEFPAGFPGTLAVCDPTQGISEPSVQAQVRDWLRG